jgi:two-component system, sensor histidine kinase and response regulator
MGQPLRALIVEDSEIDTELVVQELSKGDFDLQFKRVDRPKAFQEALDKETWDLIICDYVMPHFSEPAAIEILKKSGKDIPFIVISGKIGEETAVNAMKSGAHDYMMKDRLNRLVPSINRELKAAKQRELNRQAEEELEHFIASLTHDLRTPIIAEYRILELMASGTFGELPSAMKDILSELTQSNRFLQHMVNNIIDAYKYKHGKVRIEPHPTEIGPFVSDYIRSSEINSLLESKSLKINLELVDALPKVVMDADEIQRVLNNILKNAVEHSPQDTTIHVSMQKADRFVRVAIQDQGPGIAPSVEPYLFKPYMHSMSKKLHQVALGLGLYLSKRIIEIHEGEIGYKSESGKGCNFYFDLPVAVAG